MMAGRLSGAGGRLVVRRGVSGFAVEFVRLFVRTARSMVVGQFFLVLTCACQFGHGVGGFATNFIHSSLIRS